MIFISLYICQSTFPCIYVHTLMHSPAFVGECMLRCFQRSSNTVVCLKKMQCQFKRTQCLPVFETNVAVCLKWTEWVWNKCRSVFIMKGVFAWGKHRTSFWIRTVGHRTRQFKIGYKCSLVYCVNDSIIGRWTLHQLTLAPRASQNNFTFDFQDEPCIAFYSLY